MFRTRLKWTVLLSASSFLLLNRTGFVAPELCAHPTGQRTRVDVVKDDQAKFKDTWKLVAP